MVFNVVGINVVFAIVFNVVGITVVDMVVNVVGVTVVMVVTLFWDELIKTTTVPMYICLSKRPGLIRAGSRMSGLLVPARTTTLVAVLNPVEEIIIRVAVYKCHISILKRDLTIHLHQQLVQCVLLFTLTSKVSSSPLPPNSIDLINEEDAGGILPRHGEHVSHLWRNASVKQKQRTETSSELQLTRNSL